MLASTFGSLDALQHASLEDLTAVPDIGETTAQNILDYFASPQSQDLIDRLRVAGVNFMSTNQVTDTRFAGKTFVLTGALSLFTREEATEKIESFGGKAACVRLEKDDATSSPGKTRAASCARRRS